MAASRGQLEALKAEATVRLIDNGLYFLQRICAIIGAKDLIPEAIETAISHPRRIDQR